MSTTLRLSPGARLRALITGRVETASPTNAAPTSPPAARAPSLPPRSLSTLDDWRSSPIRVEYAKALLANSTFRDLLATIASLRPGHRGALDATTASYLLGWRTGQDVVLQALLMAGETPPQPPADVPADYGASESEFSTDDETPA